MPPTQEAAVPTVTLNNGVQMPQLGFGIFQVPAEEAQVLVEEALEAGFRHFDTVAAHRNEAGVGAAIAASGINREELFVAVKVCDGEREGVYAAFQATRDALGLDYVDLALVHRPAAPRGWSTGGWRAMEELYAAGLARAIGVSNFLMGHLDTLVQEAAIAPAVNQIDIQPAFQRQELASRTRLLGMAVQACSQWRPAVDAGEGTVRYLAAKYAATPAQILIAWHLGSDRSAIACSSTRGRMLEDLEARAISLRSGELAAMDRIESDSRNGERPVTSAFSQL